MHATAVARSGRGVLILGSSGAGKSQLALALMALGADLVADDGVILAQADNGVIMRCPPTIKGRIEARGVGILTVKSIDHAKLAIVVDMDKTVSERLPSRKTTSILGAEFLSVHGKDCAGLAAIVWCLLGDGQLLPAD